LALFFQASKVLGQRSSLGSDMSKKSWWVGTQTGQGRQEYLGSSFELVEFCDCLLLRCFFDDLLPLAGAEMASKYSKTNSSFAFLLGHPRHLTVR
jgi:hypothetical protein